MTNHDVIIIGAGAAGLMAAAELSAKGLNILVLEAKDYIGGRINHYQNGSFTEPVAVGAEFIHGEAPLSWLLVKQLGLQLQSLDGPMLHWEDNRLKQQEDDDNPQYGELVAKLQSLKEDISVSDFLEKYFSGTAYDKLRRMVKNLVEGYEAANMENASMLAMREDLIAEDDDNHIAGGYYRIIDHLVAQCRNNHCQISLSSPVTRIAYQPGMAVVMDVNNNHYQARHVLITVSLGVLKAASLKFTPALPDEYLTAIQELGFGKVIKVLLEFSHPFWKDVSLNNGSKVPQDFSFIFSDAPIPTWWLNGNHTLTGWLGGPRAEQMASLQEEEILSQALNSLAMIFSTTAEQLGQMLKASYAANWNTDPYVQGAYSYATIDGSKHITQLRKPVADTVFFAGEALYEGPSKGTVEAAFHSAMEAVKDILQARI